MGKKKINITPAAEKAGDIIVVEDNEVKEVIEAPVQEKAEEKVLPKIGDCVRLTPDATYASGGEIPDAYFAKNLYIVGISPKGNAQIATTKLRKHFGLVPFDMLEVVSNEEIAAAAAPVPEIEPYLAKVLRTGAEVKAGASNKYKTVTTYNRSSVYTIIAERDGYGKLKNGNGWISLQDIAKLKN